MNQQNASWDISFLFRTQGSVASAGQSRTSNPCALTDGAYRDRTVTEVVLSNAPFVSVMQTTDFRNRNNLADGLHRTRIRRIFIQGQMKTAFVVVADIRSQYAAQ